MSNIKMLVDRLFIQRKDENIVIHHIKETGGLKIEEHFKTVDGDEIGTHIILTSEEKTALIKYLAVGKL